MNTKADFNTEEIQRFISNGTGWFDAQDKLNSSTLDKKNKPVVYKSQQGSKTRKNTSKWGANKGSTMANQKDFLQELRRQIQN
ncbi:hypothetical protein LPJ72_002629 [Coemansia sp. Benny D160-2]|nr:hypothetical protein LPJ72_002629 [Coemansia sp. Benny D160-2]